MRVSVPASSNRSTLGLGSDPLAPHRDLTPLPVASERHRRTEHQLPGRTALQGLVIPRERRAGNGGGADVVAVEQVAHVQPQLEPRHRTVRTEAVGRVGVDLPEGRHADVVLVGEGLAQVGGAGGTKTPVTEMRRQVADQRDLRVARLGVALDRVHGVAHHEIAVVVRTGTATPW